VIDHVAILVGDLERSKAFYAEALGPLEYELVTEFDGKAAGLAAPGKPDFSLYLGSAAPGTHVAFAAPDRSTVDAFHGAAPAAGGTDNGQPGLRPHESYYGAYVNGPDGNNVEAVCHLPE
jgi:catechol 2,3-dioxygenase-like lactoylglutathione lyase family enzyme